MPRGPQGFAGRHTEGDAKVPEKLRNLDGGDVEAVKDDDGFRRAEIGFADVDCFWKYFELAIFGGCRKPG